MRDTFYLRIALGQLGSTHHGIYDSSTNLTTNAPLISFPNLSLISSTNLITIASLSQFGSHIQMALLFDRDVKTIGKHINNVFKEGELEENSTVAKFATTAKQGKVYYIEQHKLNIIISFFYALNF